MGLALFFEVQDLEENGRKCIIRIMEEDEKTFINSLTTHKFKLSSYYGGDADCPAYVRYYKTIKLNEQDTTDQAM